MKNLFALTSLTLLIILSGCSTTPQYACNAPDGGKCQSVTAAYQAALGKKAKAEKVTTNSNTASNGTNATQAKPAVTQYIPEGVAIRSMPQVMRVWIAPWEDNNGVFHDQSYNYFVADAGEWTLRANVERNIYANGYMALERPTEKAAVDSSTAKKTEKPAMTKEQAAAQAQDFVAEAN